MLNIEFKISPALDRLDEMKEKLYQLRTHAIPNEFAAWQTEDVGRRKPFVRRQQRGRRVTTVFRPHSAFEVRKSIEYQRRRARLLRSGAIIRQYEPLTSTRPILRP